MKNALPAVRNALLLCVAATLAIAAFPAAARPESTDSARTVDAVYSNPSMQYAEALKMIREGDRSGGAQILESLADPSFILADYVAYDLASLALADGEYESVFSHIARVPAKLIRRSPLGREFNRLKILAACHEPAADGCGRALREIKRGKLPGSFLPGLSFIEARRMEARGDAVRAYEAYQRIYYTMPHAPEAEEARRATVRLRQEADAQTAARFPFAAFPMREARSERLMAAFRYDEAVEELKEALGIGFSEKRKAGLRYKLGVALYKARRRDEARRAFEDVVRRHPGHGLAGQAQYYMAIIDWNRDDDDASRARLEKLVKSSVGSKIKTKAWYVLGKIAESGEDYDTAKKCYEAALRHRPDRRRADEIRWRLGWIEYNRGRMEEAARLFGKAHSRRDRNRSDGRHLYWKVRALEKNGSGGADPERGILAKNFGHTYYGVRPGAPSASLAGQAAATAAAQDSQMAMCGGREAGRLDEASAWRLRRYSALMDTGQGERAETEVDLIAGGLRKKIDTLAWLGGLYLCAGAADKSLRLQSMAIGLRESKDDFASPFWRLYYPVAHMDAVLKEAGARGVDPYLAMAVIRQESAFDATALSPANAAGLMQLLPSTGRRIYSRLGLDNHLGKPFSPEALFDPEINITLGIAHLDELLTRYNGNATLAVAAYNAGRGAVDKWASRYSLEPDDEFIERIPYSETREYVKKVMRNWAIYRQVYQAPGARRAAGKSGASLSKS